MEVMTPDHPRWDEFADALYELMHLKGKKNFSLRCYGDRGEKVHYFAKRVMARMGAVDIPASLEYFKQHGGYCDCEILMNVDPD